MIIEIDAENIDVHAAIDLQNFHVCSESFAETML